MDKPLKGIKVCDFGQHGAGSACGKMLADWGADVIKVEPFRGCGSRAAGRGMGLSIDPSENIHHEQINSNKRGIAVDLKTPEGKAVMERLLDKSDIFFSNYRLGALTRLGLDWDTLHAKYPRLICGYQTAYGPVGPKVNDPGFDITAYWSYSGLRNDCRTEGQELMQPPFGGGDMMTGLTTAAGLAACLYKQATTGVGEVVYTSLLGTAMWQGSCLIQSSVAGAVTLPTPAGTIAGLPVAGVFQSKEGEWFDVAMMDFKRQGPLIAELIGRPDLAETFSSVPAMEARKAELYGIVQDFYSQYSLDEIQAMLEGLDVVFSRFMKTKDLGTDEQAVSNHYIGEFVTRNGKTMPIVSTPIQFGDRQPSPFTNAPLIGEHTRPVLRELGYTDEEIDEMIAQHVVMEAKPLE